jgi:hypothetical protein
VTVADVLPSGYRFESIPDGTSVRTKGRGRADLYVNGGCATPSELAPTTFGEPFS